MRSFRDANVDTYQFMVMAAIKQKVIPTKNQRYQQQWYVKPLEYEKRKEDYENSVESQSREENKDSMNVKVRWKKLKNNINKVIYAIIGKAQKNKRGR